MRSPFEGDVVYTAMAFGDPELKARSAASPRLCTWLSPEDARSAVELCGAEFLEAIPMTIEEAKRRAVNKGKKYVAVLTADCREIERYPV
jgi:hypothetical protein